MSHKHFTINERNKIEILLKENYSVNKITKIIGVHRSTLYLEIKRCNFSSMLLLLKKIFV